MKKLFYLFILFSLNIYAKENNIELNWINLALIYKDRFYSRSSYRSDKFIAEKISNAENPWRIDPKLTVNYNKFTIDNSQTFADINLTQSFPTGTSFIFGKSQTIYNGNVKYNIFNNQKIFSNNQAYTLNSSFQIKQSLLKGSFLYRLPDVGINNATREKSLAIFNEIFAQNLKNIYIDYIDILSNFLLLKQAKTAVERDKITLEATKDSIQQGFTAKSDLYSFEITANNDESILENSEAQYENSLKKFYLDIYQNEDDPIFVFSDNINIEPIISYLKSKIKKQIPYEVEVAKTQFSLDQAFANKEENSGLPQLDFSFSLQKTENNTPYIYQTNQGNYIAPNTNSTYQETYGLIFSLPLYSSFTRDKVSAANAKAMESQSNLFQIQKKTNTNWDIDQRNILLDERKIDFYLKNKFLNEKNLTAIESKYKDGKATNTEVQTSQMNLSNAEANYIQAKTNLLKDLLNCAYNSGSLLSLFYEQ